MSRPLFVAVLVELKRGLASGRHAKCWKRLAEATADCAELDVTVYVFGDRLSVDPIGPPARFVAPPPVLGTGRLSGTFGAVDATNLAPCHPGLARRVCAHDVWRLTHCFAFACTAMRRTAIERVPLFASLHCT